MGKVPETLLLLTVYLDAVLHQGTGDLAKALSRYQSPILSLPPPSSPSPGSLFAHDIRILSALNAVLIIRSPFHPQHHIVEALLKDLEHVCLTNQNRQIHAAYYLVTATTSSSSTILHTKQCLQAALQASKQTEDKHLMCMILNFMSWKFFRGVVGEQAEKSARASQMMAGHCMNGLWISVSAGLLGDTLEAAGRMEDAEKARQGGYKMSGSLPHAVQEVMKRGYDVAIRDEREMADGV